MAQATVPASDVAVAAMAGAADSAAIPAAAIVTAAIRVRMIRTSLEIKGISLGEMSVAHILGFACVRCVTPMVTVQLLAAIVRRTFSVRTSCRLTEDQSAGRWNRPRRAVTPPCAGAGAAAR
ncbi:hypothetical protein GCM10010502_23200 [Kitasatospora aureofaciens]|uniref:Uncharacterized protein n=1 Tax=Kitasatospora aureofaciens TaxID=1894 RepID=A0A8H9LQ58_KITAU|nr:hypothetical protein GCM10010502_23200 [Kitasatospora aureofaciens]